MGKKKKKKKNKGKQKKYNKNQFIDIVCAQCKICRIYEPTYCYNVAYKENPDMFMSEVYPRLLRQKFWLDKHQVGPDFIQIAQFRDLFCLSGMCGGGYKMECRESLRCFNAFRDQMKGVKVRDKRKGKSKKKEPVIFAAYPTFFISDEEDFRNEIRGILGDGNRDIEQNSDKRSAVSAG